MRTFFSYLRTYKFFAAIALSMMLIELFIELIQPYIMSKVIDDGIVAGSSHAIYVWGGILLITTILAFAVGILGSFYSSHVSQSFGYDMRQALYETVQKMTFHTFSNFQEASLMTRMTNDVNQLQNTVFMGMRIMLRAPLLIVGSLVMAFIINPSLAIYLLVVVPILLCFLGWVMMKNNALFKKVQSKLDQVNRVMQQSLLNIRMIRVFVRMEHEYDRFKDQNEGLKKRTVATLRLAELTTPIVLVLINGCILLILWVARDDLQSASATSVGDIVAIVNYAMRMSGALSMISMIVTNVSRAAASMQRIDEVFHAGESDPSEETEKNQTTLDMINGHIQFSNVQFTYPQASIQTLSNINFQANAGEMIAIMGATGSGKSSLLQLLLRLYEVNNGEISIDHKPIQHYSYQSLRSSLGYVPQEVLLFSGTVVENIRWGKKEASIDEVVAAAKMAQIHETIMNLPKGYETVIGQKGVNLSGGQKQRMTIARALVRRPQILLLDDCTSALDVETENKLLSEIRKLNCTIFLVTQKMSSTALSDLILIMDDGRLIGNGTHEELLESLPLYQKISQSQSGVRREVQWNSKLIQNVTN